MNLKDLELAHIEHQSWLNLVRHLEQMKVVTKADLESSPSDRSTRGTLLFHLIRQWAHTYADLREANPQVKNNEAIDS